MRFTRVLGVAILAATTMPLMGGGGAIPVWEPTTISVPGKYVLTRNITSPNNPVIVIDTDNVHLDLNGFKIEGDANIFAADVVRVDGATSVTIENGTVVGGGAGIRLSSDTNLFRVSNVAIRGGRTGIGTTSAASLGILENNLIEDCSDVGISASGSAIQVRHNLVSADAKGISVENCDGCLVVENTVEQATDAGILVRLGSGNYIVGNTVASSGTGIRIREGGYHQIERNVVTSSSSYGLHLRDSSFDCVYRGNTVRNSGGFSCTGPGSTADFCDEGTGSTSHGDNYMPSAL